MTRKPNNHEVYRRCHQCHQCHQRFFYIYTVFFRGAGRWRADFELTPCKLTFTDYFPAHIFTKANFLNIYP